LSKTHKSNNLYRSRQGEDKPKSIEGSPQHKPKKDTHRKYNNRWGIFLLIKAAQYSRVKYKRKKTARAKTKENAVVAISRKRIVGHVDTQSRMVSTLRPEPKAPANQAIIAGRRIRFPKAMKQSSFVV
jgi:hypothetical protein